MNDARAMRRAALVIIVALLGCRPAAPMTPQQTYVSQVASTLEALGESGERLGTALNPWLKGDSVDPVSLDAAVDDMKRTLDGVREKLDAFPIPEGDACDRLDAKVDDYLLFQADAIGVAEQWAETATAENPAAEATRRRVLDELKAWNEEELKWKAELQEIADEI